MRSELAQARAGLPLARRSRIGPVAGLLATLGVLGLTACGTTTEEPEIESSRNATSSAIAEEAGVACQDFARRVIAERPEAGSPEYQAQVDALRIPVIFGEAAEDTLVRMGQGDIDVALAAVDALPTNSDILQDCMTLIREQGGASPELRYQAVSQLFEIAWFADISMMANTSYPALEAEIRESLTDYAAETAYLTLSERVGDQEPLIMPEFELQESSIEIGNVTNNSFAGKLTFDRYVSSYNSAPLTSGGSFTSINGYWVGTGSY